MLKKKTRSLFVIIFCAFTMTSCIGIIEKVFFNNNDSGTYSMTLDMSKVVEMMAAFGGGTPPELTQGVDSLNAIFDVRALKLEQIQGISNVRQEVDMDNLIFSILLDFENVDALNKGMSEFYKDENSAQTKQYVFFKKKGKNLERTNVNRVLDALNYGMNSDQLDSGFNPAALLGDMFYEQEISFNKSIQSFSNNSYQKGNGTDWDENALRWKKYLFKQEDKSKVIEVSIKTK